jgi:hypothetical protein
MRVGLALIVLVLNVVAILSILRSGSTAGRKLAWTAAVVLLPLLGAGAWLATERRRRVASSHIVNGRME